MKTSTTLILYGVFAFFAYKLLGSKTNQRGDYQDEGVPTPGEAPTTYQPLPTKVSIVYGPVGDNPQVVFKVRYSTSSPPRYSTFYTVGMPDQSSFAGDSSGNYAPALVNGLRVLAFTRSNAIAYVNRKSVPVGPGGPQLQPPTQTQPAQPNDNSRPSFGFNSGKGPAQGW